MSTEAPITELPWEDEKFVELAGLEKDATRYEMGDCRIIVGTMPDGRKHLSISHPDRYPTWEEQKRARYALLSDSLDMAMYLPSQVKYVNLHTNTFHWYECTCYEKEIETDSDDLKSKISYLHSILTLLAQHAGGEIVVDNASTYDDEQMVTTIMFKAETDQFVITTKRNEGKNNS